MTGSDLTYRMVVDTNHHDRVNGYLLDGIQVAHSVYNLQRSILSLARAHPPRSRVMLASSQFIHPTRPPCAHELVLFVVGRKLWAGALFAGTRGVLARRRGGGTVAVRKRSQRTPEAAFPGLVKGLGISDDAFGSSVGIVDGALGNVVGCRRHRRRV